MSSGAGPSAFPRWRGHLRTLSARLARAVRPPEAPPSEAWETVVRDPRMETVRLTGRLHRAATNGDASDGIVVVVHGLGGCIDSAYVVRAAGAIVRRGLDCLRLNLRGSDRLGEDYYHAGLTDDIEAAVASPALASYERIYLLGYSMGGHVVLRYGVLSGAEGGPPLGDGALGDGTPGNGDPGGGVDDRADGPRIRSRIDPRLRAIAAVCAPLHLGATGRVIDSPAFWIYRRYLLRNLLEIYREVAARRPVPIPVEEAAKIRHFREWDDRVVAPRHGFDGALDYYARASVGPRLDRLALPALLVASEDDPMVPAHTVRPTLEAVDTDLRVDWVPAGGHMAFGDEVDLHVLDWLTGRAGSIRRPARPMG